MAIRAPLTALAAGALLACAFAPLQLWPLAILAPAVLMWLWEDCAPRRGAWLGFCFGAGTFGLGTWWLLISIYGFGGAPMWLALLLLLALVAIMAAYHALLGYVACRYLPGSGPLRWLLGLPALWLLMEWWRGWFLTGFPWLSLGYSQTDTALRAYAPLAGVYGISALLLLGSGALLALLRGTRRVRIAAAVLLGAPWAAAPLLDRIEWTHPAGPPLSVAIVQGAVPQDLKWQADNVVPTRELYGRLNQQALGAALIVWPEAALPQLANEIPAFLGSLYASARAHGSDMVMGILRVDTQDHYYNSIMTLSGHVSFYDKHHLVPFAEYFPVPPFIRSWLRLMNLPYSDFTPGKAHQDAIEAGGTSLAASICYEDAYGSANLAPLARAALLVNVTNDAWFGHSWARYQHFQIARLRAIEARRPLVRAANDGVSALVGERGEVLARASEFQSVVLQGTVQPRRGLPPYARTGNLPVLGLALAAAALAIWRRRPHIAPLTPAAP